MPLPLHQRAKHPAFLNWSPANDAGHDSFVRLEVSPFLIIPAAGIIACISWLMALAQIRLMIKSGTSARATISMRHSFSVSHYFIVSYRWSIYDYVLTHNHPIQMTLCNQYLLDFVSFAIDNSKASSSNQKTLLYAIWCCPMVVASRRSSLQQVWSSRLLEAMLSVCRIF
jgi:hypothetical protein